MNDMERKKQEQLAKLARRFRDSANVLRAVARKIDAAAKGHGDAARRLGKAQRRLLQSLGETEGPPDFTYLEYLEFMTVEEFQKFSAMEPIREEDIAAVDWDELSARLFDD